MKKNILIGRDRKELELRLKQLSVSTQAKWGKMRSDQMLAHLIDQLRVLLGEIEITGQATFWGRTFFRKLVLWGAPAPKGKVQTFSEIDQVAGRGTRPQDFEIDRKQLWEKVDYFIQLPTNYPYQAHNAFGVFNKEEWGRMVYLHMDHHLKQFGL